MEKVLRIIKDYQGYIIVIASVIVPFVVSAIIKPVRSFFREALIYTVQIKVWQLLLFVLLICIIVYMLYLIRKKQMNKCKFSNGQEVMYKNYMRRMIVIKYNPLNDAVLCNWMENKEQKKGWFKQNTLEKYHDISYRVVPRSSSRNKY